MIGQELAQKLKGPLPKELEGYARGRLFEALAEAAVALRLLEMGLDRNAAGKAFQAWKSLLAAYAAAEFERLPGDREWWRRAVYEMPTGRMKPISQELEDLGHRGIRDATSTALDLHEYQCNGPDPDLMFSRYQTAEVARRDIVGLVKAVREYALRLRDRAWSDAAEKALRELEDLLKDTRGGR